MLSDFSRFARYSEDDVFDRSNLRRLRGMEHSHSKSKPESSYGKKLAFILLKYFDAWNWSQTVSTPSDSEETWSYVNRGGRAARLVTMNYAIARMSS